MDCRKKLILIRNKLTVFCNTNPFSLHCQTPHHPLDAQKFFKLKEGNLIFLKRRSTFEGEAQTLKGKTKQKLSWCHFRSFDIWPVLQTCSAIVQLAFLHLVITVTKVLQALVYKVGWSELQHGKKLYISSCDRKTINLSCFLMLYYCGGALK